MPRRRFRLREELREAVAALMRVAAERGVAAYACGGFVRDALLGRETRDLDVCVAADPAELGPPLASVLGGTYFELDPERRHARVVLPASGAHIDLTPMLGTLEGDLRRRDFTINALGVALGELERGEGEVVDPAGGLADLASRTVRAVSEESLAADPVRLLRGARIATVLGFEIEPRTASWIRAHSRRLAESAPERIRDELVRIFDAVRSAAGLRLMDSLGLLSVAMPELDATRGVSQPRNHHYYDVFGHGIATVEALDVLMDRGGDVPDPLGIREEARTAIAWWSQARDYFDEPMQSGGTRLSVLKLGGLLHDIAKPETKTVDANGRVRFFGHSEAGARIAGTIMSRLRYSAREVRIVKAMISAHLRPMELARDGPPSRRAVYKFFRDTGEAGIDTLVLSLADHAGSQGPELRMEGWRRHLAIVDYIVTLRYTQPDVIKPQRLVNGEDLMAELGLAPGPVIGRLLAAVEEAQAAGEATTREGALAVAREELARVNRHQPV